MNASLREQQHRAVSYVEHRVITVTGIAIASLASLLLLLIVMTVSQ